MKTKFFLLAGLFCLRSFACTQENIDHPVEHESKKTDTMKLKITVGASSFLATLHTNAAANAFKERLPLTITMTELNNNEKYADLTEGLPTNASNPRTIQKGDLMLYGPNTLVLFYKSFSTSYNYTRIGKIDDPEGLAETLGAGNVEVTFEIK